MLERRNRTTGPRYISNFLAPRGLWKHTHVKLIIEDCKKCPGKWWTRQILPYQNQLRQEWRARNPSSYVHLTGWRSRTLQVGARWNPTPDRCRALLVKQTLLSNITVWLPPRPPGPFIWQPFLCNQSLKPAGRNYTPMSEWSFILSGKICWYENIVEENADSGWLQSYWNYWLKFLIIFFPSGDDDETIYRSWRWFPGKNHTEMVPSPEHWLRNRWTDDRTMSLL